MKIWHPYTQHAIFPQQELPVIHRSAGAYLYGTWQAQENGRSRASDKRESRGKERRWLDAISSWWVITHGHSHPHIRKAIQKASEDLDQIIFAGFTHKWAEQLKCQMQRLLPRHLQTIFFSDSGATAIEVAIKLAIGYWHHTSQHTSQHTQAKNRLIVLQHSYHGDTHGAMSVGERSVFTQPYLHQLFEVETLAMPSKAADGKDGGGNAADGEAKTLDVFRRLLQKNPDKYAALLLEPLILGAGGMVMHSPSFIENIAAICHEYDILLIVDEIMTGWGRTGKTFALEHCDRVQADIVCYGKGLTGGFLPLAITATTEKVYQAFYAKDRSKTFFHSSSYTANPIACAAACANLEIWLQGQGQERQANDTQSPTADNATLDSTALDSTALDSAALDIAALDIAEYKNPYAQIQRISKFHADNLQRLREHAACENVRQCGTIAALDIVAKESGYLSPIGIYLYKFFLQNGVLLRPMGNVLYIMPPYCTTNAQLDMVYHLLLEGLEKVQS